MAFGTSYRQQAKVLRRRRTECHLGYDCWGLSWVIGDHLALAVSRWLKPPV